MYANSVGGWKTIITFLIGILIQVLTFFFPTIITPELAKTITAILLMLAGIFFKDSWNKANPK